MDQTPPRSDGHEDTNASPAAETPERQRSPRDASKPEPRTTANPEPLRWYDLYL